MAEVKLVAEPREGTGKGVARKLRAAGRVPAVLYGHGMESTALSVDSRDLYHVLHTGAGTNVLVDLVVDGSDHLIIPRDVQRDHIHGRFIHVDFLAVRRDEKLHLSIPVRIVGESVGVKAGGVVEHHLWELEVESLPGDVPVQHPGHAAGGPQLASDALAGAFPGFGDELDFGHVRILRAWGVSGGHGTNTLPL